MTKPLDIGDLVRAKGDLTEDIGEVRQITAIEALVDWTDQTTWIDPDRLIVVCDACLERDAEPEYDHDCRPYTNATDRYCGVCGERARERRMERT